MMRAIKIVWVFLLWGIYYPVQAQNAISVESNQALVTFPSEISFELEVESAATINDISLQYGTNGRSCQTGSARQSVEFEAAKKVAATWEWGLNQAGAIPPGAKIWWQWDVADDAGNTLTTERQEIVLEDGSQDWQAVSQGGVTVYWYGGNDDFGRQMLTIATVSLERLSQEIGITQPEDIQIWIYPTAEAVREAVVNVPEWTGGVAFPEYNITVIGVAPGETAWANEVIPHELSHLVVGIVTFNCRGIRLPTWLDEGLARYAEGEASSGEIAQLQIVLADGKLPSLRSLASGFSAYSDGAGLAYTQSGQAVQFLINQYGPEKMNALLLTMRDGMTIDNALQQVYGFDTNGLDALWREAQGYPATPTSAADVAALQTTPTLVPTLSLGGIPVSAVSATPTLTHTPISSSTSTALPTVSATLLPITATPEPTEVLPTSAVIVENTTSTSWPMWPVWIALGCMGVVGIIFVIRRRG